MIVLVVIMCILGIIGAIIFVDLVLLKNSDGGCLRTLFFLLLLGGYVGAIIGVGIEAGASGVAMINIVGIILGIIALKAGKSDTGSSSPSRGASISNYMESRKNAPHTCGNCNEYSSNKNECRLNGSQKSAEDSCSNWC